MQKAITASIAEFVEALQDQEASPTTLRMRAKVLKELSVKVPRQVNQHICQRAAEEMLHDRQGMGQDVDKVFEFLDPSAQGQLHRWHCLRCA